MTGTNIKLHDLTNMLTKSVDDYGMEISTDKCEVKVNTNGKNSAEIYTDQGWILLSTCEPTFPKMVAAEQTSASRS